MKECLHIASADGQMNQTSVESDLLSRQESEKLKDIFQQSFGNKTDSLRSVKGNCFPKYRMVGSVSLAVFVHGGPLHAIL